MKFIKVDEDSYTVEGLNLDRILAIGSGLSALAQNGDGSGSDETTDVLSTAFLNAYNKFSQPETDEEVVETPESE